MKVRALVRTFAENQLREPGDVFEFSGKLGEGLEEVNAKTNKAAQMAAVAEFQAAKDKATALRKASEDARAALEANPGDSAKAAAAISADEAASEAEREVAAIGNDNDLS